jgi:acetyl-CoA carboxylase beta subunit
LRPILGGAEFRPPHAHAGKRLELFFDGGTYETIETPDVAADPLKFRDEKRYTDRLRDARAKTGGGCGDRCDRASSRACR